MILHTCNMSNAKAAKGYRSLDEEDADFALQSLGLTLWELGRTKVAWSKKNSNSA